VTLVEMKRAILNDVLSRVPDKPLYHYTRQSGLLGIIGKRQIWATHSQYLNDRREYKHALDLVNEEIKRLLTSADPESQSVLQNMKEGISGIESMNVCVCSFSEERDSLSQWRAYGSGTSGFAIGFTGDGLAAATKKEGWFLAPCIYDPSEQRTLIRALVEEALEQCIEKKNTDDLLMDRDYWARGGSLGAYLHRYALMLKDPSFREEREWRIISKPLMSSRDLFSFREGSSLLIPYYKVFLARDGLEFRVHEVVVGPTPDGQRSRRSVRSFLRHHGLEKVPVEVSSVPYRNW
jgi:hypothetical protein